MDLAYAYQQVKLEEDSRKFVTINTHTGLFEYTRLPFGVASAPALFQRIMENLLQGFKHVQVSIRAVNHLEVPSQLELLRDLSWDSCSYANNHLCL